LKQSGSGDLEDLVATLRDLCQVFVRNAEL